MSYSMNLVERGSLGALGEVRRLAAGQEVTVRVRPIGVNAQNQRHVFEELRKAILRTGALKPASYLGWGAGDNAGLIVYKADTATDRYTLQQLANLMGPAVRSANTAIGENRMEFVTVRSSSAARGPVVEPVSPSEPSSLTPSSSVSSQNNPTFTPAVETAPASEGDGFFGKKIAGIPVWAIGAGMLALGAGAVFLATRRKASA